MSRGYKLQTNTTEFQGFIKKFFNGFIFFIINDILIVLFFLHLSSTWFFLIAIIN